MENSSLIFFLSVAYFMTRALARIDEKFMYFSVRYNNMKSCMESFYDGRTCHLQIQ